MLIANYGVIKTLRTSVLGKCRSYNTGVPCMHYFKTSLHYPLVIFCTNFACFKFDEFFSLLTAVKFVNTNSVCDT